MAEKKITDLPESSHILESDFVEFVDTNSSTSKKITLENVAKSISHGALAGLSDNDHPQYLLATAKAADSDKLDGNDSTYFMPQSYKDGWIPVSDTWTYKTATTITVPSGAASIYKVGMGIRLTQSSTVKYFYIVKVENTLLTITGGSDYTLADATISAVSYTNTPATAIGFPNTFSYTPTVTYAGGSTDPTSITTTFHFSINGSLVSVIGTGYLTRGSGDRTFTAFTLPFIFGGETGSFSCQYADTVKQVYCAGDKTKVTTSHTAMISDGHYWLYFAGLLT